MLIYALLAYYINVMNVIRMFSKFYEIHGTVIKILRQSINIELLTLGI